MKKLCNLHRSMALTIIFLLTSSLATAGFSPERIDGVVMTAQDDAWPIYFETISFDFSGGFNAEITNGSDNPSASGSYNYSKTGENTAELTYSVEGGVPSFKYYLSFSSEMSGIYNKDADLRRFFRFHKRTIFFYWRKS